MSDDLPISCDLDDCLEAIATLKQECRLTYINEKGDYAEVRGRIIDLYDAEGIDWCKLSDGSQIRLDKIETIEHN
jgi:Rho-binding antiterminator